MRLSVQLWQFAVFLTLGGLARGALTKAFFASNAEMGSGSSGEGVRGGWQIDASGEPESKCNDTNKFIASITAVGSNDFLTPRLTFRPFGVQMPPGDVQIESVRVSIHRSITSNGGVRDDDVSLLLGNQERSSNERSFVSWSRSEISVGSYTFDSESLSVSDVESSALGLRFGARDAPGPKLDGDIRIHCVSVAVEYRITTPRPAPSPRTPTTRPTTMSRTTSPPPRSPTLPNAPISSMNGTGTGTGGANDVVTEPNAMAPGAIGGGAIAAIVLSLLLVMICIAVVVVLLVQRRKKQKPHPHEDQRGGGDERNSVALYLSADDSAPSAAPSAYGKVPGRAGGQPMDASNLPLPDAPGSEMATKSDGELSFFT